MILSVRKLLLLIIPLILIILTGITYVLFSPPPVPEAHAAINPERDDKCLSSNTIIGPVSFSQVATEVANASPSTCILLRNGTYTSALILNGNGTSGNPIVVRAETLGGVVFTGGGRLEMRGNYLTVSGFDFDGGALDGQSVNQVVAMLGNNSRFTNSKIRYYESSTYNGTYDSSIRWIYVIGIGNRVDHNELHNKNSAGEMIRFGINGTDPYCCHRVDHNYLHDFPLVEEGAEPMRVGSGGIGRADTVFEYNLFERLYGEIELISVKSSYTTIRHNTLRDNPAQVTFRSSSNSTFHNNIIINSNTSNFSGIRAYGANHTITNNQIVGANNGLVLGPGTQSGECYAAFTNGVVTGNRFTNVNTAIYEKFRWLNTLSGCPIIDVPVSYASGSPSDNSGPADISNAYTATSPGIGVDWSGSSTTPPPSVTLTASPTSILSGQSSTLTWSSTNATSCDASSGWSGTKAISGSENVSPTAPTTYSLTCTGAGGNTTQSTTVTIATQPTNGSLAWAGTLVAHSNNFAVTHPVENLWDGITLDGSGSTGAGNIASFWVEFDFGQAYELTSFRLFGDAVGTWICSNWGLEYKLNQADPYTTAFTSQPCQGNQWYEQALANLPARYVRVTVNGNQTANATQARELEIYGSPRVMTPIAHYTFDNTAQDSAGTNHGTLVGSPTYTTGKIGQALSLDGVDDYVRASSNALNADAGTVSVWFLPDFDASPSVPKYLFDSDNVRHAYYASPTGIKMRNDTLITVFGNTTFSAGTWRHAVFVFDKNATEKHQLYIDGIKQTLTSQSGTWGTTALGANIYIGSRFDQTEFFDGRIDDARIYSSALSPQDIQTLYAAGNATPTPTSSPTACHTLDNTQATPAGFAASYNPFTVQKELLLTATCNATNTGVTLGNGNMGDPTNWDGRMWVWNQGYQLLNNTWQATTYTCSGEELPVQGGSWCRAEATGTIDAQATAYLGYTCQWHAASGSYKCGCADASCSTALWHVQQIQP